MLSQARERQHLPPQLVSRTQLSTVWDHRNIETDALQCAGGDEQETWDRVYRVQRREETKRKWKKRYGIQPPENSALRFLANHTPTYSLTILPLCFPPWVTDVTSNRGQRTISDISHRGRTTGQHTECSLVPPTTAKVQRATRLTSAGLTSLNLHTSSLLDFKTGS